jgi:hypothetical protein
MSALTHAIVSFLLLAGFGVFLWGLAKFLEVFRPRR